MLLQQLRSTTRQLNHGEFTPRRELSQSGRPVSVGGPPERSSSRGAGRETSKPAQGDTDHDRGSPTPLVAQKATKHVKVFANANAYRGAWLDGRMHGEGLYTWSDGSEYAGDFKEGYMWGQGEKRWPGGRSYRGKWVQDMMWGDGEMTWTSGETYTGQFRKGMFHGKGNRVWPTGDWYAGEFINGEQEGDGTFESAAEGWVYSGRWLRGRMNGEGKAEWPNKVHYVGAWKDGIREGVGSLIWPDGAIYEGQFRRNCIEGHGRKTLPNGSWFEGHFHGSELTGTGTFHWADGTEFEGLWHNSEIVGPGCHRFPDGTTITGVFEDRGATGEGTKRWPEGLAYTGLLLRNQINQHGVLKWPNGRTYHGQFETETMQGDGALTWIDSHGVCRYTGSFSNNLFHGAGLLEWSNKSKYNGQFVNGDYHGTGAFEWSDQKHSYKGQWQLGSMSGRGLLSSVDGSTGDPFVYVGDFADGHMEGSGRVVFPLSSGPERGLCDSYTGEFWRSALHGMGAFNWASEQSLTGSFKDNMCDGVGRKVYSTGQIYHGELQGDLEHGKGLMTHDKARIVGIWKSGRLVHELIETFVPALELDAIEGEEHQKVFSGTKDVNSSTTEPLSPKIPAVKEKFKDTVQDGKAIILYLNGDKYVGHTKNEKKHGQGMYVYSDLTAYKGQWSDDSIVNREKKEYHPVRDQDKSEQVLKLLKLNEMHHSVVDALTEFAGAGSGPKKANRKGSKQRSSQRR